MRPHASQWEQFFPERLRNAYEDSARCRFSQSIVQPIATVTEKESSVPEHGNSDVQGNAHYTTYYDARLGEINMENRQYKVLIVDDDSAVGELLATLLILKGHQCRASSNGAEALDLIKKEHFDAVITDVELPLMDGLTLTRELLKLRPSIAVAVMTGFSDKYTSKDAVAAGASDFLDKPFNIDELSLRFEEMMENHMPHHLNDAKDY